jgi:aminoglycoside phosphotransferase (APT) family kinase protein
MTMEARTMAFVREQGYPVPAVEELSDDGFDMVMERIDGMTMVDALGKAPWKMRQYAATLADLHRRLHDIEAPDFLPLAPVGTGTKVLHLDLHPLNVMVGPKGPFVIDWPNAHRGDPDVDVGLAWVLMAAGEIPEGGFKARLLGVGRSMFLNGFLSHFDRRTIGRLLRGIVEMKEQDPHMSDAEVSQMWRVVQRAEASG